MKLRFKSHISIICVWVIILAFITSCETEIASTPDVENVLSDSTLLQRAATSGKHTFDDGSVYQGDLIRGKPDGFECREFQNGDVYEGQFEKGRFHGHGTFRYKSIPIWIDTLELEAKHEARVRCFDSCGWINLGRSMGGRFLRDRKIFRQRWFNMSGKWSEDVLTEVV